MEETSDTVIPVNGKEPDRRITDKRLLNLRPPWPKGKSAHPNQGRGPQPMISFTDLAKKYLAEDDPTAPSRTRAETLLIAMYNAAVKKMDMKAADKILERVDPALRRVAIEGIAVEEGNAMLRRMMECTPLPVPVSDTNGNGNGNGQSH